MARIGLAIWLVCSLACAQSKSDKPLVVDHLCVDAKDGVIPLDALGKAQKLRVVFGHQSVGFDVIHGLQALSASKPERYRLTIQPQIQPQWFTRNAGMGEWFLGQNGNAIGKVDEFVRQVRAGFGDHVDVAMMKLCYADITDQADPKGIFEHWRDAYEGLEKDYPKVRFVWWTVPVPKPDRLAEKRTAINDLIRAHVRAHGQTLLDLADIESHDASGKAILHPGGGEKLDEAYSRDPGGHLNDEGGQRVGRAVWWLLARVAGWAGAR